MASRKEESGSDNEIMSQALNLSCMVLFHPISQSKTLIQLGFEPAIPVLGHTVYSRFGIGKKAYFYPNIFGYCKHIKNEIGWFNLFTVGLPSRIISEVINRFVSKKLNQTLEVTEPRESAGVQEFVIVVGKQTISTVVAGVVSYPFQVIMVRQIAQLIGHETYYNSLWSSIKEIWNNEGLSGFFSGLAPKIISSVFSLWITTTLAHLTNKYILANYVDPEVKKHTSSATSILADSWAYKYSLASVCMCVSGSRLQADQGFKSYKQCISTLRLTGVIGRGSKMFYRTAPITHVQ